MDDRNKVAILIVSSFAVSALFTLIPWDDEVRHSFFPFFHGHGSWNGQMTTENYVYGYLETIGIMILFTILYIETGRKIYKVCWVLHLIDLIDYALLYNHTWFTVLGYPVEYNHFKFVIALYFTHKEYGDSE